MPRKNRLDAPGVLQHVMFRGIEKRFIVKDDIDRQNFVDRLGRLAQESNTSIYAWALLNNHAHLLLRSSEYGLARFMRRLLTGHAIFFNRRHNRQGHLFQNRYKSIICEEENYFLQLVRYIHLNPLRAGLVIDIEQLVFFPWCGHGGITGRTNYPWQVCDYTLSHFGSETHQAVANYKEFISDGVEQGHQPELSAERRHRASLGCPRDGQQQEDYDERILGGNEFVKQMLAPTQPSVCERLTDAEKKARGESTIQQICETHAISAVQLLSGSRRRPVSAARAEIIQSLVERCGWNSTQCARRLGISVSAATKSLYRSNSTIS